jgi:chorismate mutase/prephenate dehydratase
VASAAPDASQSDQSFLGLECDSDISRARLSSELSGAGLKAETMVLVRAQGSANVLVETAGSLSDDDERLGHLGSVLRRPVVLGSYAVPIAGPGR